MSSLFTTNELFNLWAYPQNSKVEDRMPKNTTYPPCDHFYEYDSSGYIEKITIEMAVAGYEKKDLEIEYSKSPHRIVVKGSKPNRANKEYFIKNISSKSFIRKFDLSQLQKMDEDSVSLQNGILSFSIEIVQNEDDSSVRKVGINSSKSKKSLLNEEA